MHLQMNVVIPFAGFGLCVIVTVGCMGWGLSISKYTTVIRIMNIENIRHR